LRQGVGVSCAACALLSLAIGNAYRLFLQIWNQAP
jgi:hypothetical protein